MCGYGLCMCLMWVMCVCVCVSVCRLMDVMQKKSAQNKGTAKKTNVNVIKVAAACDTQGSEAGVWAIWRISTVLHCEKLPSNTAVSFGWQLEEENTIFMICFSNISLLSIFKMSCFNGVKANVRDALVGFFFLKVVPIYEMFVPVVTNYTEIYIF